PPQLPARPRERPDDRGERGSGAGGSVLRNFDIDAAPGNAAMHSLAAAILAISVAALV
ncbi:hypothetical protein GGI05_004120, partial [Coemansia sp. RSA 2603]